MKRLANLFITAATTVAMLISTCPTAAIAAEVLPASEAALVASAESDDATAAGSSTSDSDADSTDNGSAATTANASTESSVADESAEPTGASSDAATNDKAATGTSEDANTDEPSNTAGNATTEDSAAAASGSADAADESTLATVELDAEDDFALETWDEGIDVATADGDEVSDTAQGVLAKVLDAYESCGSGIEFEKTDNITVADARAAMALAFSSAEYYWAATSYSLGYYDANKNGEADDGEVAAGIYFSYYFSASEVPAAKQATEAKIAEALSWIDEDEMSAFEVAQALHDYLVRTCVYDLAAETATGPTVSHSAYGALTKGVAVCQGYALAYKLLLTRAGVPCVFVTSTSMNHAWNMVQIDGGWYHVDSTWDDPVHSDGTDAGFDVDVSHQYFLRADSTMSALGHSGWEAAYTTPTSDYGNRTYAEYKAPVSTSDSGSGGTTDGGSDGESGETSGEGSSGGTPSETSTDGHVYAHSATASQNGVTFTVQWDDPGAAGEAATFHVTQTGGSSSAKVRMDVPTYWDNGSQESVCDPTRGDWGTYYEVGDGYDFTFDLTASGTYRIYFYFFDQPNSIYYLRTLASVEVNDSARPSVSQIVTDTVTQAKQETDGSEYAMALWLHDWTLDQLKYDYDLNYCSAESGLTRAKGTCESYQRIYAKLLDAAGIANGRIAGNGHTWNAVKIDGKWCQMDLTWDDSSDNWYGDFDQRHIYFGLTDELMAIAHSDHTANYQAEDYAYRSTDLSSNYFVRNGKADEWANAYFERIQKHLDAGETNFSIDADNASYPPGICGIQNGIVAAMLNQRTWATSGNAKAELTASSEVTTESNTKWTAAYNFTATYGETAASIATATVMASNQTYTGSALRPSTAVTLSGKTLTKDIDYTVSYSNNVNVGTATVTVIGKGNYTGTAKGTFAISAANASKATVKVSSQTYTGAALTPAPTVTLGGKTLKQGTDYIAAYANNTNPGTATVTLTFKGNYTGSAKGTFAIKGAGSSRRLSGATRYDTMASIVSAGYSTSKTVIIASGENFPDALGASSLAGACGAPVILTSKGGLSDRARSEVSRLGASKAYIVGGQAAVSVSVESSLRGMGLSVERIAGNTRQETAVKIAAKTASVTKPSTVIIAAGNSYPDALSVSPYAYAKGYPIYLAEGNGTLSATTLNAIKSLGTVRRVVIVGGTAAIKSSVESQLRGITSSIERWSGATRYETSLRIAEKATADGMSWTTVAVASGENFPDALAGASLVGKNRGVLLLTAPGNGSSITGTLSSRRSSIGRCYILGGEAAVGKTVESQVNAAIRW